jgi:hypothetical protein
MAARSVLRDIYDSEINFSIETFWRGIEVSLGDQVNGIKATTSVLEMCDAEEWLKQQAIQHFPDSQFALMYRDGLPTPSTASKSSAWAPPSRTRSIGWYSRGWCRSGDVALSQWSHLRASVSLCTRPAAGSADASGRRRRYFSKFRSR